MSLHALPLGTVQRASTRLLLLDDALSRDWFPFSLTRPIGEMLFGTMTLRARAERAWGLSCHGYLTEPFLAGFDEPGAPPCIAWDRVDTRHDRLVVSSRLACTSAARGEFVEPTVLALGAAPVGAWIPAGADLPPELLAGCWPPWPRHPVTGHLLGTPWELMALNGEQIRADGDGYPHGSPDLEGHRIGDGPVSLGTGASIEPGVVLDTRSGPVILAPGARIQGPSRICGPVFIGEGSTVLGGVVDAVSVGPMCKLRGEIEHSVILGYTNKAHDGFLGHSVVGRWVNLGAMTTNSDLKLSYGPVRMHTDQGPVDTGQVKAGCLLGDHVRTGIGMLLGAGSVIGAGSTLLGPGMAPRTVPPFVWSTVDGPVEVDMDRFFITVQRVMERRGVRLTANTRRLYRRAFSRTATAREGLVEHPQA